MQQPIGIATDIRELLITRNESKSVFTLML